MDQAERARIAADFHDGPLQAFAVLRMRLHVLRRRLEESPQLALAELSEIEQVLETRMLEMRRFLEHLRSGDAPSPDWQALIDRFRRESNLDVAAQIDPDAPPAFVPLIAEALHNVHKHAAAKSVLVVVRREVSQWTLLVEDDGPGLPHGAHPRSLEERAAQLNGQLTVEGSRIRIRIPA
jgi:signal transduction histidine kinase